jgi:hypothetical protein
LEGTSVSPASRSRSSGSDGQMDCQRRESCMVRA